MIKDVTCYNEWHQGLEEAFTRELEASETWAARLYEYTCSDRVASLSTDDAKMIAHVQYHYRTMLARLKDSTGYPVTA